MRIQQSIDIAAPADVAWDVVGHRFAEVSAWASAIPASQLVGEATTSGAPGDGRACSVATPGFEHIVEQLTAYDGDRMQLTYRAASGMPSSVTHAENTWRVEALGAGRSRVTMDAVVRARGAGRLAGPILSVVLRRLGRVTLDDLRVYVETGRPSARKARSTAGAEQPRHGRLTAVIRVNVVFSLITGTALAAGAAAWHGHLGDVAPVVLAGVGLGLVGFGGVVALLGWRNATPGLGRTLGALDAGWVVGSAALLTATGDRFTDGGTVAVVGTSAVVALLAVLEWRFSSAPHAALRPAT